MKNVKITILKTMLNEDLAKEYGIPGLKACPMMKVGDDFYADYAKPEATHKERMTENINLFDFTLTDDDLQEIRLLDTGRNVTGWPSDALKYNPESV
ncbi:MAG: hypothetical protein J6M37_03145 [Prevotella sp.]|nr:hypothetical protein [Prevotella sp.]